MKITYTAPNRANNYPFANALYQAGYLHAFVSGFSRFSPRAALPHLGDKLKRHDFFQNLYVASLKVKSSDAITTVFNRLSNRRLDQASYEWARESDVFLYYRTQGYNTTQRLHRDGVPTLCVLEEVNSHVDVCDQLMREELARLGMGFQAEKFPDHALRLKAYETADYILCPSEFVRRSFIERGFASERLIKVNYGFPQIDIADEGSPKSVDDTFRILYVGQLHYRKGLRYAVEAFRQLKHPKKEFVLVGPKTPITGLERTQLPEGIIFTGPLKGEALKEQFRRASVFVLPSVEDGFGLVVGEAMSFGVPILVTANSGASDVIQNGVEGFIVPAGDVNALSERLQEIADREELRMHMSLAALEAANKLGTWRTTADHLISELKLILKVREQL